MDKSFGTERRPINLYEMTDRLGIERGWGALPLCGLTHTTAVRRCIKCARPRSVALGLTLRLEGEAFHPAGAPISM